MMKEEEQQQGHVHHSPNVLACPFKPQVLLLQLMGGHTFVLPQRDTQRAGICVCVCVCVCVYVYVAVKLKHDSSHV